MTTTHRPRWERPALAALLLATAVLLLWNLSASGYANSFYSAAAQAGGESWKAFFFGSSDAGNSITVDKPPAALWPMALSVRLFGLGAWQILAPQALMGVATTAVLYASVRRQFGPGAALLSGTVFALTPVAALMFRFNNPDALLALLLTTAVYCVLRAMEGARTKWLVWAGVALGFAFLAKTLQAFLVLPPLALLYAVCAPTRLRRRLGQLALAGAAMVVAGGWWVAVVELWPASSRPYIGGSQTNSFLELTFGYNGLGRLNGDEVGSVGGRGSGGTGPVLSVEVPYGAQAPTGPGFRGGGGGGGWGETGIGRLFSDGVGGQISWLLPAALVLLVAGLVVTWRARRASDSLESMGRAAFLAWGGCLLVTCVVFSWMQGIFHEYYTVALAPYVAALVGMGVAVLWEERHGFAAAAALAGVTALTAWWSYVLLSRSPDYLPGLRWAVLAGGLVAAGGLAAAGRVGRPVALGAAGLALGAALAGPSAYSLTTVDTAHTGSIVTAGPSVAGGFGGGRGPRMFRAGEGGQPPGGFAGGRGGVRGAMPMGPGGGRMVPGGPGAGTGTGPQTGGATGPQTGGATGPQTGGATGTGTDLGRGMGTGGGMGGLLDGARVSDKVKEMLREDSGRYTWAAAAVGAQNAASYQLASERPVMPIGGFNGSDPSPTLTRFQEYVKAGKIHYYVGGGQGMRGGGPGGSGSSAIAEWVEANHTPVEVDGTTLYDLTAPTG
ncbi:glycosyltransferase family 39 protein [Streptomyces sp. NPDC089799]|uniref:ArnT family glycosyltransferase n=1 Tax=Streptomyces sp. NPDC089799 TaxID=3155066 RepID=UPI00342F3A12